MKKTLYKMIIQIVTFFCKILKPILKHDTVTIIMNKLFTIGCKILKPIFKDSASVTPGYYATMYNKDILDKLKYPKYIIGITGSSGKGSTTSLVAHILGCNGYKVVWNKNGSNLFNAATTLILNHTNPFTKKIKADVLLMELDEAFIKTIFKNIDLTHLLVTNITRDQPARNGHGDIIINKIASSISSNTHIIINEDDPIVSRLKLTHQGSITTYGIEKTKYSLKKPISNTIDATYCPNCGKKLKYDYYHYGHIGFYECPKCNFKHQSSDYLANHIDLDKQFMIINDAIVHINKNVLFAAYYTLAAFALCNTIGLSVEDIQKELNENILTPKRMKNYKLDNRLIEMIESKNENALSYLQSINYINEQKGTKTIILGFDNVSRRYSYNDLSWLYDVDFELLNNKEIDKLFCIGRFRYDVYSRLKHAGISDNKIIIVDNLDNIINLVRKESKGNIYTMVCFDMTGVLKNKLEEAKKHEKN